MELKLTILGQSNAEDAIISVSDTVFSQKANEPLVHQIVTAYLSKARAGTKAQKTRSEVRGGGAKPWKQKGTGRARAGTNRSPIWRSGGVTFAAKPRDFSQKVNKKMYKSAMRSILSELVRQERLILVDEFSVSSHKTQELNKKLIALGLKDVLIVTDDVNKDLYLAAGNLFNVGVVDLTGVNPISLISFKKVIITKPVIAKIEEMLA